MGDGARLHDVINVLMKLILMVRCGAISYGRDAMGVIGQGPLEAGQISPPEHEWAVQRSRLGRGHPAGRQSSHQRMVVSTGTLFYPFTSRGRPSPALPSTLSVAIF